MTVIVTIVATLGAMLLLSLLFGALDNKRYAKKLDEQINRFEAMLNALDPTHPSNTIRKY